MRVLLHVRKVGGLRLPKYIVYIYHNKKKKKPKKNKKPKNWPPSLI
jgi:hypothetical protein